MNFLYIPHAHHVRYGANLQRVAGKGNSILMRRERISDLTQVTLLLRQLASQGRPVHGIIVSDPAVVQLYLARSYGDSTAEAKNDATLELYAGAMFSHKTATSGNNFYSVPVVVVNNPEFINYSAAEEHLAERYISKLYDRNWLTTPALEWRTINTWDEVEQFKLLLDSPNALLCGVDIETNLVEMPRALENETHFDGIPLRGIGYLGYPRTQAGAKSKGRLAYVCPVITHVGYSVVYRTPSGALASTTRVLHIDSYQAIEWMRLLNHTAVAKVMHNGRYDALYFLRYNAPLHNWAFDTYMMMHCWQVELRRTLNFTASYLLRNYMYWKDESNYNMAEYNAKDCHTTVWSALAWLQQAPQWAKDNFVSIFKQVFPCLTCEVEGFKQDPQANQSMWEEYQQLIAADTAWWNKVVTENFNVSSPPQVRTLFNTILGTGVTTTGKQELLGIQHKHPLWRMVVDKLLQTRQYKKADSTYLNVITFDGRILYGIDPSGTETGRYASKESSFWCGTQIQNIPSYAKELFVADDGWLLNSIDNAQSESRTTAYIVGDEALIDAVENARDFHTRNASLFFGIPEDKLWEMKANAPETYEIIRNSIGKRVNHGANYNMGANVLIQTMTVANIIKAKVALKLPATFTFKQVAEFLLQCFDNAYPRVRSREAGGYHHALIQEVHTTGQLRNPDGWVRKTFKKPWESKKDLNELVAHKPQSWSVRIINRAFFDAWYQYQLVENKMRVKAQVHDEIVYQCRPEDMDYVTAGVSELMKRPNRYTADTSGLGVDGEMVIPNDPNKPNTVWSALK